MTPSKLRSAKLKIERATKHIVELGEVIRDKQPFTYVLETNIQTNTRAICAKKNVPVIEEATVIVGDALYNLRSALDHAYWQIVSPVATSSGQERAIQFPFCETAARLEETVKNKLAHKVSAEFFAFIVALQPHCDLGGNHLLYLLHDENGVDKHRTLVPVGDYTRLSGDSIRLQIPDFPSGIGKGTFGQNRYDVGWQLSPKVRASLDVSKASSDGIIEEELNVPVQVTFVNRRPGNPYLLVPTLHQLTDLTRDLVDRMAAFV